MKTLIVSLVLFCTLLSCEEENNTDLSGTYNFIEPPHPISRQNRLDNSQVAFDVIFTIQGKSLTEVDMVLYAVEVSGESGQIEGQDIHFEGGGAEITLYNVRKLGNTLQAAGADFTINAETKTFGALQVDRY